MTNYAVEVTANARAAIFKQAKHIAHDKGQPSNAERWLDSVWDAVDSLEHFPKRTQLAAESRHKVTRCANSPSAASSSCSRSMTAFPARSVQVVRVTDQ